MWLRDGVQVAVTGLTTASCVLTDVCDWRGARVDVRTRRCGRELLGYIMAISPFGDQTLPAESVSAMVNPARVVSSPVFLQLSCEQMRTVVQ